MVGYLNWYLILSAGVGAELFEFYVTRRFLQIPVNCICAIVGSTAFIDIGIVIRVALASSDRSGDFEIKQHLFCTFSYPSNAGYSLKVT